MFYRDQASMFCVAEISTEMSKQASGCTLFVILLVPWELITAEDEEIENRP